jgi:rhomboid protease GluP
MALRDVGHDMGFVPLILWACGALYICTLVVDPAGISNAGLLSFLGPSREGLFLFGASGAQPVFHARRWWTVLSATWLHGGAPHILFNMMWIRDLVPAVSEFYGAARTVIIYVTAGAVGFLASSLAGEYLTFLPRFMAGAPLTIGASAAIFGLYGALLYYSRRGGSRVLRELTTRWILAGVAFGFMVRGVDNWAHGGGLLGGWLVSRWLDPLQPERTDHVVVALLLLAASLAAVVASVVTALPG